MRVQEFREQMAVIKDAVLDIPGGGKLPLNWQRGSMSLISNRPARLLIIRQLTDMLRKADEDGEAP